MAASDILGLFASPQQYEQQRQAAMEAQALRMAELNPMQQGQFGIALGAQQLGRAIGGALGGEDPQLKLISQRQQLASQLDPSKPESFMQAAQLAAQSGDQQFAIALADAGRKAQADMALVQQRTAEKMTGEQRNSIAYADAIATRGTPEWNEAYQSKFEQLTTKSETTSSEQKNAASIADSKGFKRGSPEWNTEFQAQMTRLTTKETKERNISFGAEAERKSKSIYGKPYADLTPEEAGKVDKAVEASEQAKAKAGAILLPGQPAAPKDWLAFSSQISKDPVMDRTSIIISDAPNAIETIRMSTSNDIASASLPGALARLTGEGKNMSDRDIRRYARTGGLDDRVAQDVVGFFTGRKTTVTKEQAERFATAVYRGALLERKKFIKDQAEQAGYDKTPNYDIAIRQLDDQLKQFKLINPSEKKTEQPKQTVSDDALINKYLPKKP